MTDAVPETPLEKLQKLGAMLNSIDEQETLPEIYGQRRAEHEAQRQRILKACDIVLDDFSKELKAKKSLPGPLTKG